MAAPEGTFLPQEQLEELCRYCRLDIEAVVRRRNGALRRKLWGRYLERRGISGLSPEGLHLFSTLTETLRVIIERERETCSITRTPYGEALGEYIERVREAGEAARKVGRHECLSYCRAQRAVPLRSSARSALGKVVPVCRDPALPLADPDESGPVPHKGSELAELSACVAGGVSHGRASRPWHISRTSGGQNAAGAQEPL